MKEEIVLVVVLAQKRVTRVTRVKKHISWKDVRRMCDQGPLCREGAPLMPYQ